jgi:hypothetical protein
LWALKRPPIWKSERPLFEISRRSTRRRVILLNPSTHGQIVNGPSGVNRRNSLNVVENRNRDGIGAPAFRGDQKINSQWIPA